MKHRGVQDEREREQVWAANARIHDTSRWCVILHNIPRSIQRVSLLRPCNLLDKYGRDLSLFRVHFSSSDGTIWPSDKLGRDRRPLLAAIRKLTPFRRCDYRKKKGELTEEFPLSKVSHGRTFSPHVHSCALAVVPSAGLFFVAIVSGSERGHVPFIPANRYDINPPCQKTLSRMFTDFLNIAGFSSTLRFRYHHVACNDKDFKETVNMCDSFRC